MRFRPRHYVLILVIVALGIWNFMRSRRVHQATQTTQIISPGKSPAWASFDDAAKLRDATDVQFQPALRTLATAIDSTASTPDQAAEVTDLRGCRTWLLFYRQEHLHPSSNKPGWLTQTQQHVDSCVKNHQDISL